MIEKLKNPVIRIKLYGIQQNFKLVKQKIMIIYVLNNEEKLASNHQETADAFNKYSPSVA